MDSIGTGRTLAREQSGLIDRVKIMNLIQTKELAKYFYMKVITVNRYVGKEGMI